MKQFIVGKKDRKDAWLGGFEMNKVLNTSEIIWYDDPQKAVIIREEFYNDIINLFFEIKQPIQVIWFVPKAPLMDHRKGKDNGGD